jgi:glutathione synthase/RimK-type ligase-like ATP-grasp enzyme
LYAASTFQHVIDGQPIRVTVVGDLMFAAAIDCPGPVDWRPGQQTAIIRPVPVPDATAEKLRRFMDRSGLEYGAFDFIADAAGEWWFLEVNQGGQYGFVEIKTGMRITAAIADLLCRPHQPALAAAAAMAQ